MTPRIILTLLTGFILIMGAATKSSTTPVVIPNPVLAFIGQEPFSVKGKEWIRYNYSIENASSFPDELFKRAPTLPPCGKNTGSSRTWLDFYDAAGKQIRQVCSLGKSSDLKNISFELEKSDIPPSFVYIELNDRETATKYKSNLAETTL